MGKPENAVYNQFVRKISCPEPAVRHESVSCPVSHVQPSRLDTMQGGRGAGRVHAGTWATMPEQVQDFYPTPSTLSTVMYYTGLDPRTMERVYVPTDPHEKAMQRALIQYQRPEKLRPRAGSASEGAPGGFDRFRCKVSHPFRAAPSRAKKAGTVKRKTQAVQVKKHAATLVCLKWQRVFTFFYTGTFRRQCRFPHRIAAFPPDTSPYPRPDLGKRCRIPASHALL